MIHDDSARWWNPGTADLDSRTGGPNAGRKVKGTIHWVSTDSQEVPVRLCDRLFTEEEPEKDGRDFRSVLNPASLETVVARVEPALAFPEPEMRFQFEQWILFLCRTRLIASRDSPYFFGHPVPPMPGRKKVFAPETRATRG